MASKFARGGRRLHGGLPVFHGNAGPDCDVGGLPDGRRQCPHWGVVLKGTQTWRFPDREEVFEAGDAYYVEPGHVPVFEAGTEVIQFSPTAEQKATDEAIRRYMESNA